MAERPWTLTATHLTSPDAWMGRTNASTELAPLLPTLSLKDNTLAGSGGVISVGRDTFWAKPHQPTDVSRFQLSFKSEGDALSVVFTGLATNPPSHSRGGAPGVRLVKSDPPAPVSLEVGDIIFLVHPRYPLLVGRAAPPPPAPPAPPPPPALAIPPLALLCLPLLSWGPDYQLPLAAAAAGFARALAQALHRLRAGGRWPASGRPGVPELHVVLAAEPTARDTASGGVGSGAVVAAVEAELVRALPAGVMLDARSRELVGALPSSRVFLHAVPFEPPAGADATGAVRHWLGGLRGALGLPSPAPPTPALPAPADPVCVVAVATRANFKLSGQLVDPFNKGVVGLWGPPVAQGGLAALGCAYALSPPAPCPGGVSLALHVRGPSLRPGAHSAMTSVDAAGRCLEAAYAALFSHLTGTLITATAGAGGPWDEGTMSPEARARWTGGGSRAADLHDTWSSQPPPRAHTAPSAPVAVSATTAPSASSAPSSRRVGGPPPPAPPPPREGREWGAAEDHDSDAGSAHALVFGKRSRDVSAHPRRPPPSLPPPSPPRALPPPAAAGGGGGVGGNFRDDFRDALHRIVADPDAAGPGVVVSLTEQFIVIRDLYPKARLHLLALLRPSGFPGTVLPQTPNDLRRSDVPWLKRLHSTALSAAQPLLAPLGMSPGALRVGFHAAPSLTPLHLHLLTPDLQGGCMKSRKHWASFTHPALWLPWDEVVRVLSAQPKGHGLGLDAADLARVSRDAPLVCNVCPFEAPGWAEMQAHVREHGMGGRSE